MDNLCLPTLEGLVQELGVGSGILSEFEFTPNPEVPSTNCSYISSSDSNIPTVVGNDLSEYDYTSSTMFSTASSSVFTGSPDTTVFSEPWLEILEQPCEMFRFRYLTESQGTPHGPVMAANSTKAKRVFPTVRLHNFGGEATIRCWLFTVGDNPGPHVHKLVSKIGQKAIKEEPHDILVNEHNNYTASFENLVIIHAVRKECYESYLGKKEMCQSKLPWTHQLKNLDKDAKKRLLAELKQEIKHINMNIVTLYFEAIINNGGSLQRICDVISRPIKNKKNAEFGDLKIVRSDREFGSCRGGDEVFIFVEKITKDIKIKFFEEDTLGNITWSDYATFSPLDIHHLVAIAFRTPPYKDMYIDRNMSVKYHLERPNDTSVSKPMNFTYKPSDYRPPLKRPRTHLIQACDSTSQLLNLDEGRMEESFEFLLSQLPSGSGEFSLTDINVDESLALGLPAVLDTDGPLDEIGVKAMPLEKVKRKRQKMLESKIVTEGRCIVESTLNELRSLKLEENANKNRAQEILSRSTHPNGCNSLHWAVTLGMKKEMIVLLEAVQSFKIFSCLDIKNSSQQTPLHIAVRLGEVVFVEKLLEAGADPNIIDAHGYAPIHIASLFQPLCLESVLKEPNCNVNLKTKDGLNALHLAAKCNNIEALMLLLKSRIDNESCCSKTGDTALHIAAINSLLSVMGLLLKSGINVNAQNYAGNTPLHFCVANNNLESASLLLKYGADPKLRNFIKSDSVKDCLDSDSSSESDNEEPMVDNLDSHFSGQNVYDLVPSKKILKLLQSQANGESLKNSMGLGKTCTERSSLFNEEVMSNICRILDENKVWVAVAKRLGHSSLISSMENSPSPSKILLNYLDILGEDEETMNNLVQVMTDLNITEAVKLINQEVLK